MFFRFWQDLSDLELRIQRQACLFIECHFDGIVLSLAGKGTLGGRGLVRVLWLGLVGRGLVGLLGCGLLGLGLLDFGLLGRDIDAALPLRLALVQGHRRENQQIGRNKNNHHGKNEKCFSLFRNGRDDSLC